LICELCKAWLVSQAQASHDLARSVQGSLFDFVAALEPVLALSVFDLHLAARPRPAMTWLEVYKAVCLILLQH
jgi:hypothetical protein